MGDTELHRIPTFQREGITKDFIDRVVSIASYRKIQGKQP